MTLEQQISLLTGNTNLALISLILEKVKAEISIYLNQEYNEKFNNAAVDMAVIKINRLGTEGLQSQSYSGVSENYNEDYPEYILKQLNSFKKKWGMA